MRYQLVGVATILMLAFSVQAGKKRTGKGPCKQSGQCKQGVCVEINDESYCSQQCGQCPAGMYCDDKLFGMIGLKVCVKGSTDRPPQPKAPPRVPCRNDKQCPGALICAEMMGQRDCTIPCQSDAQCRMPEMMGVKMDFMACSVDEGKRKRKACLPKKECLANPMTCMSVNPNVMGAMMGGAVSVDPGPSGEGFSTVETADPAAATPKRTAMSESRFKSLFDQVKSAGFEDERNAVLDTAAKRNFFSCAQVGRIIAIISFGDERISALRILAPRLVDKENSHTILTHFEFDDEKQKARVILNR